MSLALFVILAADRAPTAPLWQSALKEYNIPLQFAEGNDLRIGGVFPLRLRGREASFQFFIESYTELKSECPELSKVTLPSPVVYSLVYQDFPEGASAFYAASVLVARFGGVAFEPSAARS